MNKFLPVKIICVFLALLIACFAAFTAVGFIDESTEKYGFYETGDFIGMYLTQGKKTDIKRTSAYRSAIGTCSFAFENMLLLGGSSKADYAALTEKQKSSLIEYLDDFGLKEKNGVFDGEKLLRKLLSEFDEGNISFEKLSSKDAPELTATIDGVTMKCCYDAENDYYVLENGLVCDSKGTFNGMYADIMTDDDGNITFFEYPDPTEEVTGAYTTDVYGEKSLEEEIFSEVMSGETKKAKINKPALSLPDSLKKSAQTTVIVQMNNVIIGGEDNEASGYYHGWYAMTQSGRHHYASYEEFLDSYRGYERMISDASCDYAVVDTESGIVTGSSLEALSGKTKEAVERYFADKKAWQKLYYIAGDFFDPNERNEVDEEKIDSDYVIYIDYLQGEEMAAGTYSEFISRFEPCLLKLAACLAGMLVLLIVLIVLSGRKSGDEEAHLLLPDRIFILLRLVINLGLFAGLFGCAWALGEAHIEDGALSTFVTQLLASLISMGGILVLYDLVLYFSRNIKAHKLSNRVFVVWLIRKIGEARRNNAEKLASLPPIFKNIRKDITKKALIYVIPMIVLAPLLAVLIADESYGAAVFAILALALMACWTIVCLVYAVGYAKDVGALLSAIHAIGEGESVTLNPVGMKKALRPYAYAVNKVSYGTKAAIEKAVREQNTKTELITNISHDLKTPLTSIINYVDLLSQTDIEDEKAKEYIDVLGEKSSRLKRLIEDLIEASKATTGNIDVHLVMMSFNELCRQIVGEYEDEMKSNGLELISSIPEEDIAISADQRMIYRVLDNLMNNARKYSMPGTRVYLSLERDGLTASFTLKNISASGLNISAEELKQRFVRGDSSRTESGSGLGLSIAESFCELMDAGLDLEISGDMFTAKVTFNAVPNAE